MSLIVDRNVVNSPLIGDFQTRQGLIALPSALVLEVFSHLNLAALGS